MNGIERWSCYLFCCANEGVRAVRARVCDSESDDDCDDGNGGAVNQGERAKMLFLRSGSGVDVCVWRSTAQ